MISPRGSFACAVSSSSDQILIAGGGSRHTLFGAAGSRMSSVERYDIERDEWVSLNGLPRFRAGCAGFMLDNGQEREFWVMGGYGQSRTVSGVFPVDEYYRNAAVMELKNGGRWREIGDMWEEGERRRLGKIAVLEGDGYKGRPTVFMLDENDIYRYNMSSNRWLKETSVPRKSRDDSSFGFIVLDGELHVMAYLNGVDCAEIRSPRLQFKRAATLFIQIYNPRKKTWRSLCTKPPFHKIDFKNAVMCSVRL